MRFKKGDKVVPVSKKAKGYVMFNIKDEVHWSKALDKGQDFLYVSDTHITEYGEEVYKLSYRVENGGNYYLESDVIMYGKYNATEEAVRFLSDLEDLKKAYEKFPMTNTFKNSGNYKPLAVIKHKELGKYSVVTRVFDWKNVSHLEIVSLTKEYGKYDIFTPSYSNIKYFQEDYEFVSNDAVSFLKDLFTKDLEAEKKKKEINDVIEGLKKKLDEATKKLNELS